MRLEIHPVAVRAIGEIWRYTAENFGEDRADAYVRGIHDAVEAIAGKRMLWRPVPHEHAAGVCFTRYRHHFIFFRELARGRLGVVAVLHEKMDIPNRLKEDIDPT